MGAPAAEDIAVWHRHFAIECNNRAWQLAEAATRTAAEDEEMLGAAHAAHLHWGAVGTEQNRYLAQGLLGHVHGLLGHGGPALKYARLAFDYATSHESAPWEVAFAHAILANAGAASGDAALHREHYARARELGDALDAEDREIFLATFARIPAPAEK